MTPWTTPSDYAGYDPVGHYLVLAIHRDSPLLDRVNWDVARERLAAAAGLDSVPEIVGGRWDMEPSQQPLYTWDASHWMVGWVRYLMVRPDAPEAVLEAAHKIAKALRDYPILDEGRWSTQEDEETQLFWKDLGVRGRHDMIRMVNERTPWAKLSLFAARRDWVPDNDGYLDDLLREGL